MPLLPSAPAADGRSDAYLMPQPYGVYVHIPFCASRCDYCAFATWTDRHHLIDDYVDACVTHIQRERADTPMATSVFFGGGTPSLIPPESLAKILRAISVAPGAEITVECNPDTVTEHLAQTYAEAGVNRISLGVQSLVSSVLVTLGRTHNPANVAASVEFFRDAGITDINLDLIYGSVGETVDQWSETLDAALALRPTHISAYGLTVEAGTPLAADENRHPDDDDQADKYLMAEQKLTDNGMANYEVSNWSLPGHESQHNQLYWRQHEYSAIGCAAHGHRHGVRYWNVRTPDRYIALIADGGSPLGGSEELDEETRELEGLQLALRMRGGVPQDALPTVFDAPELGGLVSVVDGRASLTVHGRLLANEVALRLQPRKIG